MTVKTEKRGLLTGVGSMHISAMTNGDEVSASIKPTYEENVYVTPSLQKLAMSMTLADKKVYLSNQLHTLVKNVTKVELTLDAGYFAAGVAEKLQGMKKLGEKGAWSMPTSPKAIPFRFTVPFTDENGGTTVVTFPYCFLSPVEANAETEGEDYNEQIKQFKIEALPLPYAIDLDGKKEKVVYHQIDLSEEGAAAYYDLDKLLQNGWYDATTLDAAKK